MSKHNLYCFSCNSSYTSDVQETFEEETEWGTFDCTTCDLCGGIAKIVGRPTAQSIIAPPWAQYEADIHSGDPVLERKAGDKFEEERKRWASSGKWENWERGRKNEWAKNKKEWKKQQIKQEETKKQDFIKNFVKA